MRIISTCKMGPGTFEAKFIPLSRLDFVERIFVVRETRGPDISKLEYIILPSYVKKFKPLKVFIPLMLAFHTKKTKSDLIIGYHIIPHAIFAFLVSLLTGVPFACAQTGMDIQKLSGNWFMGLLLRAVFKKALFINVPGKRSRDFWIKFGVDEKKINLLHSTIDTDRFCNTNISKEYDFIILSRLSQEKRVEKLINIFSEMKQEGLNFNVAIAGDGPMKPYLEKLTKENDLDDHIDFVGFVNKSEIWFNKARCFLLSSETDAFPTALMQAMACELTVIATDVGNISDTLIDGVNGYLVQYGDWSNFKRLMITVSAYPCTEMQNRARESVLSHHSFNHAIEIWNRVLKNNGFD